MSTFFGIFLFFVCLLLSFLYISYFLFLYILLSFGKESKQRKLLKKRFFKSILSVKVQFVGEIQAFKLKNSLRFFEEFEGLFLQKSPSRKIP